MHHFQKNSGIRYIWSRIFRRGAVCTYTRSFLVMVGVDCRSFNPLFFLHSFWFKHERDANCRRYKLAFGFGVVHLEIYD